MNENFDLSISDARMIALESKDVGRRSFRIAHDVRIAYITLSTIYNIPAPGYYTSYSLRISQSSDRDQIDLLDHVQAAPL